MWEIKYGNDTGLNDESFWEWWTVTDGKKSFDCKDEDDAKWLCQFNILIIRQVLII